MIVPLSRVAISCRYGEVKFEEEKTVDTKSLGSEETLSAMGPHQRTTASCERDLNIHARLKSGIVAIGVSYSPFLWPFKPSTIRRFKAEMNADRKAIRLPRSNTRTTLSTFRATNVLINQFLNNRPPLFHFHCLKLT